MSGENSGSSKAALCAFQTYKNFWFALLRLENSSRQLFFFFFLLKWPLKTGCILGVEGVDDIQSLHLAEEPRAASESKRLAAGGERKAEPTFKN